MIAGLDYGCATTSRYVVVAPADAGSLTLTSVGGRRAGDDAGRRAFASLMERLDGFRRLQAGWDGHEAPVPSAYSIDVAKDVVGRSFDHGLAPSFIIPSAEGGVGVGFRVGERYADFECFNSGELLALTSDGRGDPSVWELDGSYASIANAIETIREHLGQRIAAGTAS